MNDSELMQQAQERISILSARVAELEALNEGNLPVGMSRMQERASRQSKALDRLNRKVLTQRFRLREIDKRGRDLTLAEYVEARDAHHAKDRISEYAPVG